jgi:hypothetical protein
MSFCRRSSDISFKDNHHDHQNDAELHGDGKRNDCVDDVGISESVSPSRIHPPMSPSTFASASYKTSATNKFNESCMLAKLAHEEGIKRAHHDFITAVARLGHDYAVALSKAAEEYNLQMNFNALETLPTNQFDDPAQHHSNLDKKPTASTSSHPKPAIAEEMEHVKEMNFDTKNQSTMV